MPIYSGAGSGAGSGGGLSYEKLDESTSFTLDGTEQTLFNQNLKECEISGYINLDNMELDDKIILRTYIDGYINAVATYENALLQSLIVITPIKLAKERNYKLTIEQTQTGTSGYKNIGYELIKVG